MAEIIDLRNYRCPQSIIALKKMGLAAGVYKILTSVMDSSDINGWAHRSGHRTVSVDVVGNERVTIVEIGAGS